MLIVANRGPRVISLLPKLRQTSRTRKFSRFHVTFVGQGMSFEKLDIRG